MVGGHDERLFEIRRTPDRNLRTAGDFLCPSVAPDRGVRTGESTRSRASDISVVRAVSTPCTRCAATAQFGWPDDSFSGRAVTQTRYLLAWLRLRPSRKAEERLRRASCSIVLPASGGRES